MEKTFQRRISYGGDINVVSKIICEEFDIGDFLQNKIIMTGYEDFNFMLRTSEGKFLVKILANFRTMKDCKRYADVLAKSLDSGVSTPKLLKSSQGYLHTIKLGKNILRLFVMDFIDGKTFYKPEIWPTEDEIRFVAHQAALINAIKIKPAYVFDNWAITNIFRVFKERKRALGHEDLKIIKPVLKGFSEIHVDKLPHCFVHGDILKTNMIKDKKGGIWILDFAVSNYYPRIVEMAVLACNVLFDKQSKEKSGRNLKIALKEYQKTLPLTEKELNVLPTFVKAAHAMHIVNPLYERKVKRNVTKENEYWLDQGRSGLRQMTQSTVS